MASVGALGRRVYIRSVAGCEPYDDTYDADIDTIPPRLRTQLFHYARDLSTWPVERRLWLFRDMLTAPVTSKVLRAVFAYLRAALVRLARDARAALYAPVTPERRDLGFNLHADLFLTTRLWLVFDDVPRDGSGATQLLPRLDLINILDRVGSVPRRVVSRVSNLMSRPLAGDAFDELYGLLHGENKRWHGPLVAALRSRCASIPLRSGEGYLLDDREWLHGRRPVSRAVTARRFHRLTFSLRTVQSVRRA
jgi:hypothetical protein